MKQVGRAIGAVIAGYAANAILIVATEQLLSPQLSGGDATQPLYYFVLDLISQCFYQVLSGYLCCAIARPSQRIALAGLVSLGLVVGTFSVVVAWKSEPHWYGIALLLVYAPCVWIGWALRSRAQAKSFSL